MSDDVSAGAEPLSEAEAAALFDQAFRGSSGVLLAVSGGPDSMALLGLAARWPEHPPLAAATVDHGLRAASAEEARMVAVAAAGLGIPHHALAWSGSKPETGLQAAAREARYALLVAEAKRHGFSHIATAHHADDQAETVLMRLAAGSGIAGLACMRPESRRDGLVVVRPLLGVAKARLVATCAAFGLPFAEDPSNADPRYGRVRARRALALLAAEGLGPERFARLAVRAARADEALAAATRMALSDARLTRTDCVNRLDWRTLSAHPEEIRLRALAAVMSNAQAAEPQRLRKLEALLAALDCAFGGGSRLRRTLGGDIVTLTSDGRLTVTAAPPRRGG